MASTKKSALDLGCTVDLTALRMHPEPVFRRQAQAQAFSSQASSNAQALLATSRRCYKEQASSNKHQAQAAEAQATSIKQQAVKAQAIENNLE